MRKLRVPGFIAQEHQEVGGRAQARFDQGRPPKRAHWSPKGSITIRDGTNGFLQPKTRLLATDDHETSSKGCQLVAILAGANVQLYFFQSTLF